MGPLTDFAKRFHARIQFDDSLVISRHGRYFLLNKTLKKLTLNDFFCSGIYLGLNEGGDFVPSFNFLFMLAQEKANKISVDRRTEWLFICGRDIFKRGIRSVSGLARKGDFVLVENRSGECLGYGQFTGDFNKIRAGVVVKNLLDVGDFLRREKPAC